MIIEILLSIIVILFLFLYIMFDKYRYQLHRGNQWKDEYIKAQKRNKMTERGEELLQQLTDNNNK